MVCIVLGIVCWHTVEYRSVIDKSYESLWFTHFVDHAVQGVPVPLMQTVLKRSFISL